MGNYIGSVKWQDLEHDRNLETFAGLNKIDAKTLTTYKDDVIIIPNNTVLSGKFSNYNLFSHSSKNVYKALKDGGLNAKIYDDGKEKRELILKSADVILPIFLFSGITAASAGLTHLSNWVQQELDKDDFVEGSILKVEYLVKGDNGTITRWRKIDGPVRDMGKILADESQRLVKEEELWWAKHCKEAAQTAITQAQELIQQAETAINEKNQGDSEELLRKSLVKIREATLYEPNVLSYKIYLHNVGRKIHDTFGCKLEFKEDKYWVTCPVLLSHYNLGFSVGGCAKPVCSICGMNIFDCDHIDGEVYNDVVAKRFAEVCNICGSPGCHHQEGQKYHAVQAFVMVTEFDVDHISMVAHPTNPLGVVQRHTIPASELQKILPEGGSDEFIYGKSVVNCHHCLFCNGDID